MDRPMRDYTDLLLERNIISLDQLNEAEQMAKDQTEMKTGDALVSLGYVSPSELTRALADFHRVEFVDLEEIRIPEEVIELVPESVARENTVIPIAEDEMALKVLISDPFDIETIEKLRFILNRKVETALAPDTAIKEAINRYYGQVGDPKPGKRSGTTSGAHFDPVFALSG